MKSEQQHRADKAAEQRQEWRESDHVDRRRRIAKTTPPRAFVLLECGHTRLVESPVHMAGMFECYSGCEIPGTPQRILAQISEDDR